MNSRPPLPDVDALMAALTRVLQPMADLAVAKGLGFDALEEALKRAVVHAGREAAMRAQPGVPSHRLVSRISTATGINRREVTRINQLRDATVSHKPPAASEVFTRWLSDPQYAHPDNGVRSLPRQGDAPSFESLAQSVTRDVHPRSILDELCRLGLADIDARDRVTLRRDAFVPKGDELRMMAFLADNVGDHLSAAVANTLSAHDSPHFEQALFADELSAESLQVVRHLLRQHWQHLLREATDLIERRIDHDRQASTPADQRIRIGLYSYSSPTPALTEATPENHQE